MSLYRLIDEESDRQPVSRLCRTLGVTRSGFYDWQGQPLSDRALADWLLSEQIRGIFEESEQTYGSPRIFKELKLGRGLKVGEKRVARLMRQAGLVSIHAKKRKGSTTRAKENPLAPDLVGRDFAVNGPIGCGSPTSPSSRPGRARPTSRWSPTPTAASASAGRSGATRPSSSCLKRWTWRSGGAARCGPPARSITATRARSLSSRGRRNTGLFCRA